MNSQQQNGSISPGTSAETGVPGTIARRGAVVVSSGSAAAGRAPDRSGPVLCEWLNRAGYATPVPLVVADGAPVGRALRGLLAQAPGDRPDVIVTSGGTGSTPDDQTPEQTAPLLDRHLPGIMHALYAKGCESTPLAALSRGLAGISGRTVIVNLPGSPSGVRDGIVVLDPILEHLLNQIADIRDHAPR